PARATATAPAGRAEPGRSASIRIEPFLAQLGQRVRRLLEVVQAHPAQDARGLRELNFAVFDDLQVVAPGVEKVEAAAAERPDPRRIEGSPDGLLVVDDETEVTRLVGRLAAAFGEGDELVAHVDERHPGYPPAQLELEDP